MPDKILGMPKKYAIVVGAGAAGILAYAWWRNGMSSAVDTVTDPTLEAAVDDYDSPLGSSGTNSTGSYNDNVDTDTIDTNSEWTQAAVEFLQSIGYEASAVVNALGKYLQFKALNTTEVQIVMAARASVGDPPVGGPYPIKEALPTPTTGSTKPGAISGLRQYGVYATLVYLDWNDAANSNGYDIQYKDAKGATVNKTALTSSYTASALAKNRSYTFKVRARPKTGSTFGDWSSITVKTKAK